VTGSEEKEKAAAGKSEDEIYLEKQLQSASEELARKQQKEQEKQEREQWSSKGFGVKSGAQASSVREKYLDKIKKLKEKKKQEAASHTAGLEEVVAATSAGLSTWIVNDGANEVLVRAGNAASLRGSNDGLRLTLYTFVGRAELLGPARIVQGCDPACGSTAGRTKRSYERRLDRLLTVTLRRLLSDLQDEYKFFLKEVGV